MSKILIYGDDVKAIAKMAKDIKASDNTADLSLCSARRFSGTKACNKVLIVGDHPEIAAAYEGLARVEIIGAEEPATETLPALPRQPKRSKKGT